MGLCLPTVFEKHPRHRRRGQHRRGRGLPRGPFYESLNQAAVEKLPLAALVVANNHYAYSTPSAKAICLLRNLVDKVHRLRRRRTLARGKAPTCKPVLRLSARPISRARQGRGPQMVVARLLRLCGHGEHDDASYVDPRLRNASFGRDCLKVAEEHLFR